MLCVWVHMAYIRLTIVTQKVDCQCCSYAVVLMLLFSRCCSNAVVLTLLFSCCLVMQVPLDKFKNHEAYPVLKQALLRVLPVSFALNCCTHSA